jgi:hypothetical protein
MDCPRVTELLVDYLYHEMDPSLIEPFEAHIASCPQCTEQLKAFQATRAAVQSLPELEPPDQITQGLMAKAAQALRPKKTIWDHLGRSFRFVVMHPAMTATVTLLLVVGISFYAYRQSSPPQSAPRPTSFPEVVQQPTGSETQSAEELSANQEATLRLQEEDSTASIAARKNVKDVRQAPARAARVRAHQVEHKVPLAQPATEPPRPTAGLAPKSAVRSSLETDRDRFQAAPKPRLAARRRVRSIRRPRRPVAPNKYVEGEKSADVKRYLALGNAAAAKQLCHQALEYYDRVLELRPQLEKSLDHNIRRCIGVIARHGEAPLLKAQKQFPRLSGLVGRELARLRKPLRKRTKAKAKPHQRADEKVAPSDKSVGY